MTEGRVLADVGAVVIGGSEILLRGRAPVIEHLTAHLKPFCPGICARSYDAHRLVYRRWSTGGVASRRWNMKQTRLALWSSCEEGFSNVGLLPHTSQTLHNRISRILNFRQLGPESKQRRLALSFLGT